MKKNEEKSGMKKHANDSGVSLIEIVIAAIVVSVAGLLITSFTRSTLLMSKDSRSMDAAFLAGEQKIVALTAETNPALSGEDTVEVDDVQCIRTWTIKDTLYITRAVVSVVWKSNKGDRSIIVAGAIN